MTTAEIYTGQEVDTKVVRLINRTGAALTKGMAVAKNLDFAATAGQAMVGLTPGSNADSAAGFILAAGIVMTTENMARGVWICKDDSIADNAEGNFYAAGDMIPVSVADSSNAGEFLVGTSGLNPATTGAYLTSLTLTELASQSNGILGILLEANASGAAAVKKAQYWGGLRPLNFTGT